MKIGVVIGSVREHRAGDSVAKWVIERAQAHGGADFVLLDVAAYDLPFGTSPVMPAAVNKAYEFETVQKWSRDVDSCDAFIFVTPEYNHSVPGPMKNAFDLLAPEWRGKVLAFVSYGAVGGVRSVEHWRQIAANSSMYDIRTAVSIMRFAEFEDNVFKPSHQREGELKGLFDDLLATVARMTVRDES